MSATAFVSRSATGRFSGTAGSSLVLASNRLSKAGRTRSTAVQTDAALSDKRLKTIVQFALKINKEARSATEADIMHLREVGLTDKGVVRMFRRQLIARRHFRRDTAPFPPTAVEGFLRFYLI